MTEYFEMSLVSQDIASVKFAVNQGIDSRLEGFTKSKFNWGDGRNGFRLECKIHPDEMQVLIRRLVELGTDNADLLADDIVRIHYGNFDCPDCHGKGYFLDSTGAFTFKRLCGLCREE